MLIQQQPHICRRAEAHAGEALGARKPYSAPMRTFNTAGPCVEGQHYMIEPLSRLPDAEALVESGKFFVVHAPRQTGKTTILIALAKKLNADGRVAAVYFNGESAKVAGDDFGAAERIIVDLIREQAPRQLPADLLPPGPPTDAPEGRFLGRFLSAWAEACPRPIALLFDEIDSLVGMSLHTILRQLRTGYAERPAHFPSAILLCGMKDVRDYQAAAGIEPARLGTASPFNVKVESERIGDFTRAEVNELLDQHTTETGQAFTPEARDRLYECCGGQPWLTNAIAREIIEKMAIRETVTVDHVDRARERLVLARATHLDSLLARLREERVRRVLMPIMAGDSLVLDTLDDDLIYLRDLGLIARDNPVRIANSIYREIIVRVLGSGAEANITTPRQRFIAKDGRLDRAILLKEFMDFWIQHGEVLVEGHSYHEVAPQLVLMAYLHRVVNGGGFVDREYGIGRGRIDLLIRWPVPDGTWQREAFELKVWRDRKPDPLAKGLEQLDEYLDGLGMETGVLALFDRRKEAAEIEERTGLSEAVSPKGRRITVLRA